MQIPTVRFTAADSRLASLYALPLVVGLAAMVFVVPPAIRYFFADPIMAVVTIGAALGWIYSIRAFGRQL